MELGLVIDITCCGSDCFGNLNNPVLSDTRIIDGSLNEKWSYSCAVTPEEPIVSSVKMEIGSAIESQSNNVSLDSYLNMMYRLLEKCKGKGMYLVGFNHVNYDMKILNRHFVNKLHKQEISWERTKIIDLMEVMRNVLPYREIGSLTMDSCYYYLHGTRQVSDHVPFNDNCHTVDFMRNTIDKLGIRENCLSYIRSHVIDVPVTEFRFGKYKGMAFDEVYDKDRGYMMWLKNHTDNDILAKQIQDKMDSEV